MNTGLNIINAFHLYMFFTKLKEDALCGEHGLSVRL